MNIHTATKDDASALVAMAVAFRNHLERKDPTQAQFKHSVSVLLDSPDARFLIAAGDEGPVGYVLIRFRYSMWICGTEATIEDLFVDPSQRKKGIGRSLMEYALQVAAEQGCLSVCLDTNEFNIASTRIYTQLGFNSVSKRWNGRQVFFRKPIQSPHANS
ncbi:MAG: GNAT family N-acetyltransferase [Acidobacteria bacterium]|nr:GNAT family N-acetyltransferase [Acidobacteriota bacterium]MBI3490003.1 GNAT family N-acetyltransferase [Acidobacteriota bacterium]